MSLELVAGSFVLVTPNSTDGYGVTSRHQEQPWRLPPGSSSGWTFPQRPSL